MIDKNTPIEPGQIYEIDIFRPDDAPGVARLFWEVYGEGYPVRLVYEPEKLIEAFYSHTNIPIVARTPKGDMVGYVAFYNSAPHKGLYELGQGLILSTYRSLGINSQNLHYAVEAVAPQFGMDAVFGESVCNHVYMQKAWAAESTIPTALEVDLMPAEAYSKEGSALGRVSALSMFRTMRSRPHTLFIPDRYKEALEFMYEAFDDERTFVSSREKPPANLATELKTQIFEFAKVARVAISTAGVDFPETFSMEEEKIFGNGMVIIQVWLKLTCPWIDVVIEYLRMSGYFFGGALPRWFDDDAILMHKINGIPNWEGIKLYSDRSKKILELVRADWEAVNNEKY